MKSLFLFILFFLSACSKLPKAIEIETSSDEVKNKIIYASNHGKHTGIIINTNEISSLLPELANRFNSSSFIEIGWGDKEFYQSKQGTILLGIQALFWPTDSVVHVVGFNGKPEIYFSNSELKKISISNRQYQNLIKFIVSSFAKSDNDKIISSQSGVYGNSQFYKGVGDYYAMNTCNTWTAKALISAGQKINPSFKLTAPSVMQDIPGDSITHHFERKKQDE